MTLSLSKLPPNSPSWILFKITVAINQLNFILSKFPALLYYWNANIVGRAWACCNKKRMLIISTCWTTLNCSLEETTDLVTMATTTWTSHINHGIMDILSCHVCKGIHHHTNQKEPPSGKYRNALQYISPNCHYILSHISQSHVSPKTILIPLGEKDNENILFWDSKGQSALMMTFDLNFMGYGC